MNLKKFLDLFYPCGNAHVVYWTKESEEIEEAPLWEGPILDTPYWIIKEFKIGRYDDEWDGMVDLRGSLGQDHNNMPGLVITLVEKDEKDS